ncbi:MAG: nucleoside triphosphate pyrophosphohydrolase [bacterium]|nr:nucleoside triphosphate pyrophosphohydrolase [bacterium]
MDNLSTKEEKLQAFSRLLDIMDELREKCPWDKKQTLDSLRHLTIEETYEMADAIIKNDLKELQKELGDVLLHIVFYARITSEMGKFDITSIINTLCEKLIVRHPHIYGDVVVENEQQVKENWEQIKLKEGNKSVLSGVTKGAPSLVKALRIQDKASQVGFDWETSEQVWGKVHEELEELKAELDQPDNKLKSEQEFGDLLFALTNLARKSGLNPDDALEYTNQKFITRFMFIEERAKLLGKSLTDMSLEEMDAIWNEAKIV